FIIFDKMASILKNFLVSVTYVLTTKMTIKYLYEIVCTKRSIFDILIKLTNFNNTRLRSSNIYQVGLVT
ncbi:hypothetical protein PN298_08610, partial [Peptostreptococcus anaerobius]|uniref:hypothetical protein n=1 Tax=Peptostreptococcus anaerobius TaxID=1261 RepID=UPI002330E4AE